LDLDPEKLLVLEEISPGLNEVSKLAFVSLGLADVGFSLVPEDSRNFPSGKRADHGVVHECGVDPVVIAKVAVGRDPIFDLGSSPRSSDESQRNSLRLISKVSSEGTDGRKGAQRVDVALRIEPSRGGDVSSEDRVHLESDEHHSDLVVPLGRVDDQVVKVEGVVGVEFHVGLSRTHKHISKENVGDGFGGSSRVGSSYVVRSSGFGGWELYNPSSLVVGLGGILSSVEGDLDISSRCNISKNV
jgi:hypothetical protein